MEGKSERDKEFSGVWENSACLSTRSPSPARNLRLVGLGSPPSVNFEQLLNSGKCLLCAAKQQRESIALSSLLWRISYQELGPDALISVFLMR